MNRRAFIFLAVVGAAPILSVLMALALLLSAVIGRDFVWRQTETDLGSAIENGNPVAMEIFAAGLGNIDTPIPYSHPRILASKPMLLPPIAIALVHDQKYIVKQFLDAGSDPATALGKLPLEAASALLAYAIRRESSLGVTYLVKHRVDQHQALTIESRKGRLELIPLELAIYYGDRRTTEALVSLADIPVIERGLMYAVRVENSSALDIILRHKAQQGTAGGNTSGESHDGMLSDALTSAAGLAASMGNSGALKVLAKHGVDLNAGSPFPPICRAIEGDHTSTLRTILENGGRANPSTHCADGLSPLGFAVRLRHRHAISVLEAAGGQ